MSTRTCTQHIAKKSLRNYPLFAPFAPVTRCKLYCKSIVYTGWEVVQLVGHQTLTLGILVRVQASQPIF